MLGDFASLDVQNTYRGSDAYVYMPLFILIKKKLNLKRLMIENLLLFFLSRMHWLCRR
ncbi:hypothetical protein [Piscirickettsia salmonis]|uniref:hypothetical protein n=1 Tax=Piscirickettsia salmonis TaxID=1238 RepID=UPI001E53674C|nr:hypothetical protein [Piscirickettsia salmonis]